MSLALESLTSNILIGSGCQFNPPSVNHPESLASSVPTPILTSMARLYLVWVFALLCTLVTAKALPNLRILTLGDSITKGNGSGGNPNGYRSRLRGLLVQAGAQVDMIGTLKTGTMADNDHEGHSGKTLKTITTKWQKPIAAKPNLILIHAGTNNMDLNEDLDTAPTLYANMLDGMFNEYNDVVILVVPVIYSKKAHLNKNRETFNAKLKTIVKERQDKGKHIHITAVDITDADLSDEKHPNIQGYNKFADAFFAGVNRVNDKGWLVAPAKIDYDAYPDVGLGRGQ